MAFHTHKDENTAYLIIDITAVSICHPASTVLVNGSVSEASCMLNNY
jgi:hypothetical protein